MPTIYLVRHARPTASWGEDPDPDPGLDSTGLAQAQATADELAAMPSRLPIHTSPLRRCRETALPLERAWQRPANVFEPAAEIPSPPISLVARREWLTQAMRGTWHELQRTAPAGSVDYLEWRRALLAALNAFPGDCVVFSHFIAINVAVAAALEKDAVVCFRPDHASVTVIETSPTGLRMVRLGREADTSVLTR